MNTNQATRRVDNCGYLSAAEKVVLHRLLAKADYGDCALPERFTPTAPELAGWLSLKERAVRCAMAHAERHGWVARETHRGRGRPTLYRLLPRTPDPACDCPKRRTAAQGNTRPDDAESVHEGAPISAVKAARKGGTAVPVNSPPDDTEDRHDGAGLSGEKAARKTLERRHETNTSSQVRLLILLMAMKEKGLKGEGSMVGDERAEKQAPVGYEGHQAGAWKGDLCRDCRRPARGLHDRWDESMPLCTWCGGVRRITA